MCACRESKQLEKSVPEKRKKLAQCEEELASLTAAENKLTTQLKGLRAQTEEGRSSLEAFRSRYRCAPPHRGRAHFSNCARLKHRLMVSCHIHNHTFIFTCTLPSPTPPPHIFTHSPPPPRGKVLQCLLQQRDSGAIPGVRGRLGDLGTINEKYDVAVSTACGALDHIVVDSMDTAVKCVNYLKKSGVGCATFIGLDKVEHLRGNASKKMTT